MFTTLPVRLSFGTKQMLHGVHLGAMLRVHITVASTYTQISILSGKMDFNCT